MEQKRTIDNRFEIIRKLGEGGTSKVYLAFDHQLDQNIALKVLKSEIVTEQKIRYFNREAQAISMLNNSNVIRIYCWGHDNVNDVHYIAQEYIEGMTIKEYLKLSSNLAITEVVALIEKILDGLAHAHLSGVIHKDIKGQNILIDEYKNIKITDFGIADILEDEMTKTQSLMGTPQYVAPETLNRNVSNAQTDIYSVGILMYELLCGQAPFTGDKPTVIMLKQINQPLPSIRMQRNDVPQALENIVIKATAKKLENRYTSCEEMLFDLATVFETYNEDVPKLVLENDLINSDELEHTIEIDSPLNYKNLQKESTKSQNRQKQRKIILISLIIIIPFIIGTMIMLKPDTYSMPELIGKELNAAKSTLAFSGVSESLITVDYETSNEIPEGQIILTDPEKGTEVYPDEEIKLVVSSGPETYLLEDYVGKEAEAVKKDLEEKGYVVETISDFSSEAYGYIFDQSPKAGEEIKYNGEVTLYVSEGSAPITIENFIGLPEENAQDFISENDLIGTYNYECNNSIEKDIVISQNPSSGAMLDVGGNIEFNVSTGTCDNLELASSIETDDSEEVIKEEKSE